jgi:hypothetical protein
MTEIANQVPDHYRGVWVRTLLETPTHRDDQTFVRWLQTGRWHADLRVPAGLVRPAHAPARWTPAEHAALSTQQGFCGVTEVQTRDERDVCTWHRRIDDQPPGLTPDAGWMEFESSERVIETGVHGIYREVWERLPDSTGRSLVLERTDEAGGAETRLLVAGRYLMRVRGRTAAWPADTAAGTPLAEVLTREPADAAARLDFEISFGALDGEVWCIERSTLPALEGKRLRCMLSAGDGKHARVALDGEELPWKIVEWRAEGERLATR